MIEVVGSNAAVERLLTSVDGPPAAPRRPRWLAIPAVIAVLLTVAGLVDRHHEIATAQPIVAGQLSAGGVNVDDTYGPGERLLSETSPSVIVQTVHNAAEHPLTIVSAGESGLYFEGGHAVAAGWFPLVNGGIDGLHPALRPFPVTVAAGQDVGLSLTFPAHPCHDSSAGIRNVFPDVIVTVRYRGQTLTRDVPFATPLVAVCG